MEGLFISPYVTQCLIKEDSKLLIQFADIVNEEYLAVLIQQQYVTDLLQPWKAIFTVCLRNPCCVEVHSGYFKCGYR